MSQTLLHCPVGRLSIAGTSEPSCRLPRCSAATLGARSVHPVLPLSDLARNPRPQTSVRSSSSSGDSEALPIRMSVDDAYKILGVTSPASFEEVLKAKNRMLSAADGDMEKVVQVETAYDLVFMTSMKRRLTGELEVSTSIRYADVPSSPKKAAVGQKSMSSQKAVLQKVPAASVAVEVPKSQQQVATQAAVFAGVGTWALATALLESPEVQLGETAGIQMAVALGFSIYTMKEAKKMQIGKAVGLSVACLFAGALVGTALQSWLRVDIVPIGAFGSPGVFVTEVIILAMALGSVFLV